LRLRAGSFLAPTIRAAAPLPTFPTVTFIDKLSARWQAADSLLCVGLDPDPSRFPAQLRDRDDAIFAFCAAIADATAEYACAFKPQVAYFASARAEDQLERLLAHLRQRHPQVPVVLDAKRGDIGATAEHYAREAFERYGADAVTLSPFMGRDSIEPFMAYADRGIFVLCRTSNPGGDDLQMLEVGGEKLYERVARLRSGTAAANSAWWSVPPTRPSSPACAPSQADCRCWCRASARRAATCRPAWLPARAPAAPAC
jgi:orotidine-5'-phosphate decarboxylase